MQVVGLIPLISANVHPMAVLYSRRTLTNLSSSCAVSEEEMMTGSVSCSPKNTYFKWLGNGLSSRNGGWITEGSNLLVELELKLGYETYQYALDLTLEQQPSPPILLE
ncbi:hypothetical protein TB1_042953 [Malus domestica]